MCSEHGGLTILVNLMKLLSQGRNLCQEHEEAFGTNQPESLAKTEPATSALDPIVRDFHSRLLSEVSITVSFFCYALSSRVFQTGNDVGVRSSNEHSPTNYKSVSESDELFCVLAEMDELEEKVLQLLHTTLSNHRNSKKKFLSQGGMHILLELLHRKTSMITNKPRLCVFGQFKD